MIRIATVFAFALSLAAAATTATAQNDAGKKTSDGFGNLLRGMGQELNKAGATGAKKDAKKTSAKKDEARAAKKE